MILFTILIKKDQQNKHNWICLWHKGVNIIGFVYGLKIGVYSRRHGTLKKQNKKKAYFRITLGPDLIFQYKTMPENTACLIRCTWQWNSQPTSDQSPDTV